MTYRRIAEKHTPRPEHLAAIESAIKVAYPDAPDMRSWYEGYAGGQKNRLAFDLDWVRRFATGDKIVEFGAMPPILTVALARQGYPVVGLDLAPSRFQDAVCKEGLSVQAVDFETQPLPFADDSIDVAIFNEVFEHLRVNPIFTFREIGRVLRGEGTLLLSTPNLISWKGWYFFAIRGRLPMEVWDEYRKLETLGHMGHVRLYSPSEVTKFLEQMGFRVEVIIHRGKWPSPPTKWLRTVDNVLPRLAPRLRTHFTIVAKKVA